jgi:predicted MFS family arabinose efflux permease
MQLLKQYKNVFANIHKNVWILSATLFVNRSGSMVLLFCTLYFTQKLGFTKAQAGTIMSCFGIGSILGSYFGGWLADRYNQKNIMIASLLGSGLIVSMLLLFTTWWALCIILFLYALVADSFRPSSSAQISANTLPENRARSVSLMRLAINLGFTIGPAIGGVIAFHYGYTLLFLVDAFTSIAAGIFLYFFLPSKKLIKESSTKENKIINTKSAYSNSSYLLFIGMVAIYGTCFFQLLSTIPSYFKEVYHYKDNLIGIVLAINGAIVVIVEMPLVSRLEKNKQFIHRYVFIGCICIAVANFILLCNPATVVGSILYIIIISFSEIFAMPFMMSYAINKAPKGREGQYTALYSMGYGISLIAAPFIGLGIAQHLGFAAMLTIFAAVSILLSLYFLFFLPKD